MGQGIMNEVAGGLELAAGAALIATGVGGALGVELLIQGAATEAAGIAESLMSDKGGGITTRQGAAPRRIIYGTQRVSLAGASVYQSTTGDHKQHWNTIAVVATHPCNALLNLYLDGRRVRWPNGQTMMEACAHGSYADTGTYTGPNGQQYSFGSEVYCHVHMGTETAATVDNSDIRGDVGGDPTWPENAYGGGCTWIYLRTTHDTGTFPSFPDVRITVQGKDDIYDPRTGKRGYTDNWALCVADMIGTIPGVENVNKWGVGDVVNEAQLIAAANCADEQVTCAAGVESRYTLETNYNTTVAPADAINRAMAPAEGRLSNISGEWYIWPAYWQGESFTFDESSLVDKVQWSAERSISERANVIFGTYTAPNYPYNVVGNYYDSDGWYDGQTQNNFPFAFTATSFPPYALDELHGYGTGVDVYLDADNGVPLPKTINLQNCLSIAQAQRVAKIVLLRNRQQGSGVLRMNLAGLQLRPTDVIEMNFAALGWTNKLLEVVSVTLKYGQIGQDQDKAANGYYVEVGIQETDPSVYEWESQEELTPYDVPAITTGSGYIVPPPTNLTIEDDSSTATVAADGTLNPRLLVTWVPPTDTRVNNGGHIEAQYQITYPAGVTPPSTVAVTQNPDGSNATAWIDTGLMSGHATCFYVDAVPQSVSVTVQVRAIRSNGSASAWVSGTMNHATDGNYLGIPQQVTAGEVEESPYKTASGQMKSLVTVDFTPGAVDGGPDPYFDHAEVWFTGFADNPNPQLMATGAVSPVQFLCDTTHETVTVTVVAASAEGKEAVFAEAPTASLSLDGVTSAPPAPSIWAAQTALPNGSGWQFTLNVLNGLVADLIQCYRVYHADTDTVNPATDYYTTIAQPPTNMGTLTVSEVTGEIMYYWVSAVSVSGYESELTPVPFTYVDPNAAAPSVPSPVVTTKSYYPTTYLNGWAANARAGNYEGGGNLGSEVWGLNNAATLGYGNPGQAFDANEGTYATASFAHTHQYAGCIWSFSDFAALPANVTVQSSILKVMSSVVATSGPVKGHADIWYSLDGGETWKKLYASYNTRNPVYDTVNLDAAQDITKIQVMAFTDSHDDIAHQVMEIRVEQQQSAPAGPETVTGVTASLGTDGVTITFNGLTPTSRADIIQYEITRAVVGSDYAHSYTHAQLPFVSGQASYSWTDTEVHDASFVWWVVAQNSTGWSAPSAPASITGAASLIYSNGQAVEALRPAEPLAEVTTGKSITVLTDRTADNISYLSGDSVDSLQPSEPGAEQTAGKPIDILTDGQVYGRTRLSGLSNGVVNLGSGVHVGTLPRTNTDPSIIEAIDPDGTATNLGGVEAGSITPISELMPAEAGAERTTGKPIDIFTDGEVYGRTKLSGLTNGGVNFGSSAHAGVLPRNNTDSSLTRVIDEDGNLVGSTSITGVSETAIPISTLHDRVSSTIASASGSGLDNVANGTTYGRPLLSRLSGGKPIIDFSEAIHLNKSLANIPDGNGRYASSEAGSDSTVNHVSAAGTIFPAENISIAQGTTQTLITFIVNAATSEDFFVLNGSLFVSYTSLDVSVGITLDGNSYHQFPGPDGTSGIAQQGFPFPVNVMLSGLSAGSHTITIDFVNGAGTTNALVQVNSGYAYIMHFLGSGGGFITAPARGVAVPRPLVTAAS